MLLSSESMLKKPAGSPGQPSEKSSHDSLTLAPGECFHCSLDPPSQDLLQSRLPVSVSVLERVPFSKLPRIPCREVQLTEGFVVLLSLISSATAAVKLDIGLHRGRTPSRRLSNLPERSEQ